MHSPKWTVTTPSSNSTISALVNALFSEQSPRIHSTASWQKKASWAFLYPCAKAPIAIYVFQWRQRLVGSTSRWFRRRSWDSLETRPAKCRAARFQSQRSAGAPGTWWACSRGSLPSSYRFWCSSLYLLFWSCPQFRGSQFFRRLRRGLSGPAQAILCLSGSSQRLRRFRLLGAWCSVCKNSTFINQQ